MKVLGLAIILSLGFSIQAIQLDPLIIEKLSEITTIEFAPDDNRSLYVLLQKGKFIKVDRLTKKTTLLLDLENKIKAGGELGLLGLAFHPKFQTNHKYYLNYTVKRPELTTVVVENNMLTGTSREILSFYQPYSNHNGGQLSFGPDGYLYIGTGDGGSANDPEGNGQNVNTLLGKILRLDVDAKAPYGIPSSNPFAQSGGRKEIYAWGLRNPWRFSFDKVTGWLWAGDVGQNHFEEIDVIENGKNYGWNKMEGNHCFPPGSACSTEGLSGPVWEYGRREGISVTGGYVYRGKTLQQLRGKYIYGDYGSGRIWALSFDLKTKKATQNELILSTDLPISTFGQDEDGEVWVASHSGKIFKLSP